MHKIKQATEAGCGWMSLSGAFYNVPLPELELKLIINKIKSCLMAWMLLQTQSDQFLQTIVL
jgi:hypothetical protein